MSKFLAEVVKDPDSDDLLLIIPSELLEKLNWQEETTLVWSVNDDTKTITIRKSDT